jgi:hypothetical protein
MKKVNNDTIDVLFDKHCLEVHDTLLKRMS